MKSPKRAGSVLFAACVLLAGGLAQAQTAPLASANVDQAFTADVSATVGQIVHDQKKDFLTFPSEVARGKYWAPVLLVSAATAGLVVADQYDTPYFRRTNTFNTFNSALSGTTTAAAIIGVPVALYAFGHFEHDTYARHSAILAAEAAVDGEIAGEVIKLAGQRRRPESTLPNGNFGDSFGDAKSVLDPSFPSEHAIAAFSIATVMSERYGRRHRWVPIVSYAAATAIGFSRMTSSAHYPADVFFGAALGYAVGRFSVSGSAFQTAQ